MKLMICGAGGVGSAVAALAAGRDFAESIVVADLDKARAERAVTRAREKVRLIGSSDQVRAAIERRATRATGLSRRLRGET